MTVLAPNSFKIQAARFISSRVWIFLSIRSSASGKFGVMTVTYGKNLTNSLRSRETSTSWVSLQTNTGSKTIGIPG